MIYAGTKISKSCYAGLTIRTLEDLISAATFNKAVYHYNWGLRPARVLCMMQLQSVYNELKKDNIYKVINVAKIIKELKKSDRPIPYLFRAKARQKWVEEKQAHIWIIPIHPLIPEEYHNKRIMDERFEWEALPSMVPESIMRMEIMTQLQDRYGSVNEFNIECHSLISEITR